MSNEKYESVVVLEELENFEETKNVEEPELILQKEEQVNEEQVNEEQVNEEKDIVIELLDILVTNKNVSSIQLTKKQIDVLNIIIANSPSLIKDINTGIISIIKDGRIDALDIPQLIILIKEFYTFCHQESTIKISVKELVGIISPLIKYIIHIILNKNNTDTPELLSCCDRMVDVCMEIIELQSSLKTVGCELGKFFSCL